MLNREQRYACAQPLIEFERKSKEFKRGERVADRRDARWRLAVVVVIMARAAAVFLLEAFTFAYS